MVQSLRRAKTGRAEGGKGEGVAMTKIKPLLTVVAVLALMLLAGAGSAAFAGPQGNPDTGIKAPPRGQLAPSQPCKPKPGIAGGTGVGDCKYPFIAALLDHQPGSAFYYQLCGGTLIDSDSVLTAAHCVDDKLPTDLAVVVGRTQLTSKDGQWREVSRISIPGQWNPSKMPCGSGVSCPVSAEWDVAIVHLKSPVTGITPVRLALSTANWYEQPGRLLTIAGWGNTMDEGVGSDRMQEAKVPVVSDADAAKSYSTSFVPDLMIAAGGNGKDTCPGDSGGPLFAPPPSGIEFTPSQYGITSFGGTVSQPCGGADPGVYTEVNAPSIRTWIEHWRV